MKLNRTITLKNGQVISAKQFYKLKRVVIMLTHFLRKSIIEQLLNKPQQTVTELYVNNRCDQSVMSQHLALLRGHQLVSTEREGKNILYSINQPVYQATTAKILALSGTGNTAVFSMDTANVFALSDAIGHDMRLRILGFIDMAIETPVAPIYKKFDVEQSIVSQHLRKLRQSNLVSTRRSGKYIFYKVNYAEFERIMGILEKEAVLAN